MPERDPRMQEAVETEAELEFRRLYALVETDDGRKLACKKALYKGIPLDLEQVELAARSIEDSQHVTERDMELLRAAGLSFERVAQMKENVQEQQRHGGDLYSDLSSFEKEQRHRAFERPDVAGSLTRAAAEEAEAAGEYETALLRYLYAPQEELEKTPLFFLNRQNATESMAYIVSWMKERHPEAAGELISLARQRLDAYAVLYDRQPYLHRAHSSNLVPLYLELNEFGTAARRAETNRLSFMQPFFNPQEGRKHVQAFLLGRTVDVYIPENEIVEKGMVKLSAMERFLGS